MHAKPRRLREHAAITLCVLAAMAHFVDGAPASAAVVLCLLAAVAVLFSLIRRRHQRQSTADPAQGELNAPLIHVAEKQVADEAADIDLSVLGRTYRKAAWDSIEETVDTILDNCIKLVRSRIEAQTVAVLFPTEDGGYRFRRYDSRSDHINENAVIYPGVGVIGSFLKDGLKQLKLEEILSDSMTLHYYNRDAGVRSLMASPIVVDGVERGTIIADSTETRHFCDEDHAHLKVVAELAGRAVYYAYLYNEHRLAHARLAAMSSTEKYFLQEHDIDAILDKLAEIIPFAFSCRRMTISIKDTDSEDAKINRAWGVDAEGFQGLQYSLAGKSLAAVVCDKNISLYRNFAEDRYEARYSDSEPRSDEMASFLAHPIGVQDCKGVIILESDRRDAFGESNRDLLARLVTSVGVAIEKIQILRQTETLATHDGLTGLNNHRQFQQLLKEAITRSGRYQAPLALALCDIDFFKKVNDTYGHRFGDTVLKTVAAKLQSSIREGVDSAARYGGEEFALVLEKMDARSAVETVDRIRQHISELTFQSPQGREITVTMSFGIAIYIQHARTQETLIRNADKALYRAKENGRNRVELYYDPEAKTKPVPIQK